MRVTVVLCTYNRCKLLAGALASLAAQRVPKSLEWEVLVIDNNSADRTREVVEEFSSRQPGRFRYLFEAQQGKSFALNAGIREARGAVVAFVDDDITCEPGWLENIAAVLETHHDWAGVGGRIVPTWTRPQPSWLRMSGPFKLGSVLVSFDFGGQPCVLDVAPFGANMAFRREVFGKYGGFRTDLGPTVGNEIRGEDSEFCRRLMRGGEQIGYAPAAIIYHPVPENRISKKYFQAWFYDYGRAQIREKGRELPATRYWGVPRYLFRHLLARTAQWLFAVRPHIRFYYKVRVWQIAGEIHEAYATARESA